MSLTVGRGPFARQRAGRFDFDPPAEAVYVEPFLRRVRAVVAGEVVIDSDDVLLVHETGSLPRYAFPAADVRIDADQEPHAAGHVAVPWDGVDAWYEEDERVEVHPQPSDTRTECPYKGTARHWSAHVAGRLVDDVAWQYDREVRREAERVRGLYAFYDDRTRIEVDG